MAPKHQAMGVGRGVNVAAGVIVVYGKGKGGGKGARARAPVRARFASDATFSRIKRIVRRTKDRTKVPAYIQRIRDGWRVTANYAANVQTPFVIASHLFHITEAEQNKVLGDMMRMGTPLTLYSRVISEYRDLIESHRARARLSIASHHRVIVATGDGVNVVMI